MTEEAFGHAVRTYGDTVYRVALHALKNPADAEDVMQTVMLRLLESGRDFESEEHLKHWILRVAGGGEREPEGAAILLAADLSPAGGVAGRSRAGGPGENGVVPGGHGAGDKIPSDRISLLL